VAQHVEQRSLFRKRYRMMNRQRIHSHPEAQPARPLRCGPENHVGRGKQGKSRLAMNLGDPKSVKAQTVGQLRLCETLVQPRFGGGTGRTLNFREKTEFHT
jgi:hypothetical protein